MEFHFDPKDDSLKVSANSVEKSGYGFEWVNMFMALQQVFVWDGFLKSSNFLRSSADLNCKHTCGVGTRSYFLS